MLDPAIWRMAGAFGTVKGTVITVAVVGLDIEFWKALVIAAVAALIGVAGSLLSAYYSVREARKNRALVQDVSRKIGTDRRAGDTGPTDGSDAT